MTDTDELQRQLADYQQRQAEKDAALCEAGIKAEQAAEAARALTLACEANTRLIESLSQTVRRLEREISSLRTEICNGRVSRL